MSDETELTDIIAELRLTEDLARARIKLAKPLRDKGIDYLAYRDREFFRAIPLQLKGGTGEFFSIDKKYERIPDLLIVYMWHVHDRQRTTFALTYPQVFAIAQELGWTGQETWKNKGRYSTSRISDKMRPALIEHLSQYAMTEEKWRERFTR